MAWRIYYADGSSFDSDDGAPEDAPTTGVLCIKQSNQMSGWILLSQGDYYLWHDEVWWGADAPGFYQYMFKPGAKVVKFGETVPDETWNEIAGAAAADQDFGPKSSKHALE